MRNRFWPVCAGLACLVLLPHVGEAAARMGSAVTLRVNGDAQYESPDQKAALHEGLALSQGHRYLPAEGSYIDSAVTMGGLIRVRDGNDLLLKRLEQSNKGLPGSDKTFARHIVLEMKQGTLFMNAGESCDSLAVQIKAPFGDIESHGSRFVVQQSADGKSWRMLGVSGRTLLQQGDRKFELKEGETLTLTRDAGNWKAVTSESGKDSVLDEFRAFWLSTQGPEQYLMCLGAAGCVCFDCFTDWMGQNLPNKGAGGAVPPLEFIGDPLRWLDVSPATRR